MPENRGIGSDLPDDDRSRSLLRPTRQGVGRSWEIGLRYVAPLCSNVHPYRDVGRCDVNFVKQGSHVYLWSERRNLRCRETCC